MDSQNASDKLSPNAVTSNHFKYEKSSQQR
jgi:hypothetical protein